MAGSQKTAPILEGTSNLSIVYKRQKLVDHSNEIIVKIFSDADFASDETRRSTSGILCLINDSPIIWKSQRQPTISVSTTEAELVAACYAIKETIWLQQCLVELKCQFKPVTLYVDNQAALKIVDNEIISSRTKHLDIKYKFILESRKMHKIQTEFVGSDDQLADILTIPLPRCKFLSLRTLLVAPLALITILLNLSHQELLKQESSILWLKTDKVIPKGAKIWDITVAVKSPCINLNTPNPAYNDEMFTSCQHLFNEEILLPMNNMCSDNDEHNIEKRQLGFGAGVLTEYFATSLVETVRGWIVGSKEQTNAERIAAVEKEMYRLNNHANEVFLIQRSQNDAIKILAKQVTSNTHKINEMAINWPKHAWMAAVIQYDIKEAAKALKHVIYNWKNRFVGPELGTFLKIDDLQHIDPHSSMAHRCTILKPGIIRLQFVTRAVHKDSFILQADPFKIYVNLTGRPCLHEYIGPKYVIHNVTANCTKPIKNIAIERYQVAQCQENNGQFATNTSDWKEIFCQKDLNHIAPAKEVKTTRTYTYIYCINNNITINSRTHKCPPHVFKLSIDMPWILGEDSSQKMLDTRDLSSIADTLPANITDQWSKDGHEDSSGQLLSKIADLQNLMDKLDPELVHLSSTTSQVKLLKQNNDIMIFTLAGIGALVILVSCITLILYIKRLCTKKEGNKDQGIPLHILPPPPANTAASQSGSIAYGSCPSPTGNTYLTIN